MLKIKYLAAFSIAFFLLQFIHAQSYEVQYNVIDGTAKVAHLPSIQSKFTTQPDAAAYIIQLPQLLKGMGYVTASVDSIHFGPASAAVTLFFGEQYKWASINVQETDKAFLNAIRWPTFQNSSFNFSEFQAWQNKLLSYLEENGHPFAKIYLDSVHINNKDVSAQLKIERGPLYKIDSIRIYGNATIKKDFLQRYLDIFNGSIYNSKKIKDISKRLKELTYVQEDQPATVSMLGTGSILNLYLSEKKSSQVNVLVGLLPNADVASGKKFLVTGEANVLLRNSLGSGETIGLNWQQLQVKSPRLNLLYNHPFVFQSPFGLNMQFDMFRKDSSFLNINMQVGTSYFVEASQTATIFLQRRLSLLSDVDTVRVKQTRRLPISADVASTNLGINYNYNSTDYRFNPKKGNELLITATAGTKNIKKNNQIATLKDANDPTYNFSSLYDTVKLNTYQVRIEAAAAHYFPLSKLTAIKTGIKTGAFFSQNIFYNELFQIGGYRTLRGFTEESEYLSKYAIGTVEYRYLIGPNSAFFAFFDGGWGKGFSVISKKHTYLGTGVGMNLETGAGIFNLAWAIGKRNDTELNLRQSKVHLGFVNYF